MSLLSIGELIELIAKIIYSIIFRKNNTNSNNRNK
jgi:hypothetical protein